MRSFSRMVCLLMALQVLVSSMGFAINEHFCKIRGAKVWSFTKKQDCCKKTTIPSKTPLVSKAKCCADKVLLTKVVHQNIEDAQTKQGIKKINTDALYQFNTLVWLSSLCLPRNNEAVVFFHAPAPPLSGRAILLKKQSFLI